MVMIIVNLFVHPDGMIFETNSMDSLIKKIPQANLTISVGEFREIIMDLPTDKTSTTV
jgi:hypothetical protein